MTSLIRDISDTARWVAVFRAEESERPDAVFQDPFARRLAGERGWQIASAIGFSRVNSWSFVARTYLFDDAVRRYVADGVDTIVNLGAGLDTRPYRMALPSSLTWVEADLPAMMAYKENALRGERPVCRLERVAIDLADRNARLALFERIGTRARNVLVTTEGLIAYLTEDEAAGLATDLSRQVSFRRWVLDLSSPGLLALARAEMSSLDEAGTSLKFGPAEGEEFFQRYGWRPIESRSLMMTGAALNRLTAEMMEFASIPEPKGPRGDFPWAGVCVFSNLETW